MIKLSGVPMVEIRIYGAHPDARLLPVTEILGTKVLRLKVLKKLTVFEAEI